MTLYEITKLERDIETYASEHEGEISDEMLKVLVEAETKSLQQIEGLCRGLKNLEYFEEICEAEEDRIKALREKARNRRERVKEYLAPYVESKGKIQVGTFTLSIRKSYQVKINPIFDMFENDKYIRVIPEKYEPDKDAIKKAIQAGEEIEGAWLEEKINLQVK